jgi:penicillin-binding protein A
VNRQLQRIGVVVLLLFGALFVNLNVISLLLADDLATHPANRRLIVREYAIERGPLVVGEDAVARSEETGGELSYLRTYPEGPRYAHLTGYYSVILQRSGLEEALNEDLTGRPTEVVAQNLGELLGSRDRPGNTVQLTVDPAAQTAAERAIGDRVGAVVAIDPVTGAVLASYANPTFDPNPLSSHDPQEITDAWLPLRDDPDQPLLDRTRQERYPPGSVFKLIVAAAALERGLQPDSAFPDELVYDVPQTSADIGNYGGGLCADGGTISLSDALRVSCNTVFARLGVQLGADAIVEQAQQFGFNRPIPFELDVVPSVIPDADDLDPPAAAQSSIGQRDVAATPMQLAVVAASIANGGQLVRPHVVAAVLDPSGRRLRGPESAAWTAPGLDGTAVSPRTADQLRDMMIAVVDSGTGTGAQIEGVEVGGKTGTAEVPDGPPVTWFVGFAEQRVAVAVVVPGADDDDTGGRVAAPIAREVMAAVLGTGS